MGILYTCWNEEICFNKLLCNLDKTISNLLLSQYSMFPKIVTVSLRLGNIHFTHSFQNLSIIQFAALLKKQQIKQIYIISIILYYLLSL